MYKELSESRMMRKEPDPVESLKLSLNLNFALFKKDIQGKQKQGLRILKKEIENALGEYADWTDEERPKIKQQVELIQENINLWVNEGITTDSDEDNWHYNKCIYEM